MRSTPHFLRIMRNIPSGHNPHDRMRFTRFYKSLHFLRTGVVFDDLLRHHTLSIKGASLQKILKIYTYFETWICILVWSLLGIHVVSQVLKIIVAFELA